MLTNNIILVTNAVLYPILITEVLSVLTENNVHVTTDNDPNTTASNLCILFHDFCFIVLIIPIGFKSIKITHIPAKIKLTMPARLLRFKSSHWVDFILSQL
jgi:hypothetical protein